MTDGGPTDDGRSPEDGEERGQQDRNGTRRSDESADRTPDGPGEPESKPASETERQTGSETERETADVRLSVPDMDCASCAGKVESGVRSVEGVREVDPRPTTGTVTVSFDPSKADRSAIVGGVEAAGYAVADEAGDAGDAGGRRLSLTVPEMDCASCAGKVQNALSGVDGVTAVETRPTGGSVVVSYDLGTTDEETVVAAVEGAGYPVTARSSAGGGTTATAAPESIWTAPRALKTWASGLFVAAGLAVGLLLGDGLSGGPAVELLGRVVPVADLLFVAAIAVGGQAILRNGYYSARNRNLDIDLLMSAAILGALVVSVGFGEALYFEAATLAFLFSVAELLERHSMDRARRSLRELMDLSPDEATVQREGETVTVPVEDVAVGETVVVRPGEKVPLDGEVVDGASAVNQAPVTGESVPVDKTIGDAVYAGTINEEGYLAVRVTAPAGEDTLSRVVDLVEAAQSDRTEREQFVERFADYYTPVVVGFAVLLAVVPPLVFQAPLATYVVYGLTLLVLACPCAFVISTPVTVVSGITSAAKNGVLVKGGSHLEAMGDVDVVAFDKTGTLTKGELTVTDVVPLGDRTEADVLACARGLESRSEHPIGEAIVGAASDRDVAAGPVENFSSITGKGVRADLGGDEHYAGKPGLFEELGFDLTHVHAATDGGVVTRTSRHLCERNNCLDLLEDTVPALQAEGKTVVLVGTEEELEGVVAVADELRPEAADAVARLTDLGVTRTVMLTGDNERTARAIADRVGIDEVHAGLLPEEKTAAVRDLVDEHGSVAMVGDGINDAPALATATVGIAMGAAGTDTAIETADVALLADDLTKLPYLYELSHTANGVIRQNVWTSLGAKALLALGVPFGLVPIWAAVLVGDAGMTTAVTGNAMRLGRISAGE